VGRAIKLAKQGQRDSARQVLNLVQNSRVVEIPRDLPFPDFFPVDMKQFRAEVQELTTLCIGCDFVPLTERLP